MTDGWTSDTDDVSGWRDWSMGHWMTLCGDIGNFLMYWYSNPEVEISSQFNSIYLYSTFKEKKKKALSQSALYSENTRHDTKIKITSQNKFSIHSKLKVSRKPKSSLETSHEPLSPNTGTSFLASMKLKNFLDIQDSTSFRQSIICITTKQDITSKKKKKNWS